MEEKRSFDSWKEIAAYLNRSIKTCQRWEGELGLPVHRQDHGPGGRIFAHKHELDRWLLETRHLDNMTVPDSELVHSKKLRRALMASAALVVVAAGAVLGWRYLLGRRAATNSALNPSLAILSFENPQGDEVLEKWKTALPDLMITDLMQSRFIHVVPPARVYAILSELNLHQADKYSDHDLARIAEKAEAGFLVSGRLLKATDKVLISVSVQNPLTGEIASPLSVECRDQADIFPKVDELTKKTKRVLNLSSRQRADDIDRDIALITTRSPEAFIAYSEGNRWHDLGRGDQAVASWEKAMALDPDFALAYWKLSAAYGNAGRKAESEQCLEKAFALTGRASDRDRLLIEGDYYASKGKDSESMGAYQKLLSLYPNDYQGNVRLAKLYAEAEQWDNAAPLLEKILEKNRGDTDLHLCLADCYAGLGFPDRADKLLEDHAKAFPEKTEAVDQALVLYAVIQRKFDDALRRIEKADILSKARIHVFQENLAEAEKEFQTVIDQGQGADPLAGRCGLVALCLLEGRFEEAMRQATKGLTLARNLKESGWEPYFHYLLARICRVSGNLEDAQKDAEEACRYYQEEKSSIRKYEAFHERAVISLEMNQMEAFDRQAEELKRMAESDVNPGATRFYYHLLGLRELKGDNLRGAFDYAWKALDLVPPQCAANEEEDLAKYSFLLEEVSGRGRDPFSCYPIYRKVDILTVGRTYSGDDFAKSLYRRGKLEEWGMVGSRGSADAPKEHRAEAIKCYQKFLDLWKNADPGLTEVEDAKTRLKALLSQ